jgi:hypothetical protein
LLRRREEAFEFAYHFYEALGTLFSGRRLFLLKNQLAVSCRKETLANILGGDVYLLAEEAWTKKILKLQEELFINTILLKLRSPATLVAFTPSEEGGE